MSSEERITRLEAEVRRLRLAGFAAAAVATIMAFSAFAQSRPVARFDQLSADTIRVRNIIVADPDNVERVRIAAPLPDPIMLGKRFNRGEAVSGILLFDGEGNERGGYVTSDESRAVALTLDEVMRAAVHIGVNDRGESHITFSNGLGGYGGVGMRADTGPYLRFESVGGAVVLTPDTLRHEVRK